MFRVITIVITLYCLAVTGGLEAQQAISSRTLKFSLEEAQNYAFEHNYDLINSATDVEIARKMVKENTAIGLPQVDASIDYIDNFLLPTTMLPGEFFGQPGTFQPIQFGTQYNATVKGTLTQLIYSGQYLVGLQTARAYLETARQKNVRDRIDIRDQVADVYIRLLVVDEGIKILDSTLVVISRLTEEARKSNAVGLIEDIEVEQADLNRSNLEATLTYTKNQRDLLYANLKFLVGLKDNEEMTLTNDLEFFLAQVNREELINKPFDYQTNIDFLLLKKSNYLTLMQYKLSKTAFQPTLAGFLGASTSAQRTTWNLTDTGLPWYAASNFGFSLKVPLWSSGSRKFKVDQARLNVEKSKVASEKMRVGLELQVANARTEFNNAYMIYQNRGKGFETSLKIYEKTMEKYKQGMSGSTDLNQRYQQFLAANNEYMQSIYNLLSQKIRLNKLLEKH